MQQVIAAVMQVGRGGRPCPINLYLDELLYEFGEGFGFLICE